MNMMREYYNAVQISNDIIKTTHTKVHLVSMANNEPFVSSQKAIFNTIQKHTKYTVVIHEFNIERIKARPWFNLLERIHALPEMPGRRDGYYCAWKPFLIHDVYQLMDENDVLYYVDSSKYWQQGYTDNLDMFIDEVRKRGNIAGSVGDNVLNSSYGCLTNRNVWKTMGMEHMFEASQSRRHVLSAWMAFTKTPLTTTFLKEWVKWTNTDDYKGMPLVVQHHTAEQAILNILFYKYPEFSKFFRHPQLRHDDNKNYNTVLKVLNTWPQHMSTDVLYTTP